MVADVIRAAPFESVPTQEIVGVEVESTLLPPESLVRSRPTTIPASSSPKREIGVVTVELGPT